MRGVPRTESAAFSSHKCSAKWRGIEFYFTKESWCAWWKNNLGSDWFKKRGPFKGQYVMARKGDKGPYVEWNVECILSTKNNQDQALNGLAGFKKGHAGYKTNQDGIKITPAQAKEIYLLQGFTQKIIAQHYGISERLVRSIKKKKVWVDVLAGL